MRALLLAALIASPAIAEIAPRPVGPDPRIRSLAYDPDEVFRLNLAMKFITHIRFAPGEAIQSVSVGDSASWQIVRLQRGDVLAIKPLIAGAASNMNVITDRRSYVFELRARWLKAGSRRHAWRVSFTYPQEEAAEERDALRNQWDEDGLSTLYSSASVSPPTPPDCLWTEMPGGITPGG